MKTIIDNLAINYFDQGEGSIILMLHGWGVNALSFEKLAMELARTSRVIRIDFPGFGQSDKPKSVWGVEDYALFVKKFLDKINIDQPDIILGHSFGGRVAIRAAANKILHSKKIILISAAAFKQVDTIRNRLLMVIAKTGNLLLSLPILSTQKEGLKRNLYKWIGSEDYIESGPMKDIFIKTINEDLTVSAASINSPTLLIWGENDIATPLWQGKRLALLIDKSKLTVIAGAGHFPFNDNTKEVVSLINNFK